MHGKYLNPLIKRFGVVLPDGGILRGSYHLVSHPPRVRLLITLWSIIGVTSRTASALEKKGYILAINGTRTYRYY
jgi:hypothetical protein